jgi:DNA-binding MarR family transcriptional regulator
MDKLGGALLDLAALLNSPQRDEALLREAGVAIDRALFPLLVALGARGQMTVAEVAELVGRDHTTVSRQLAKLDTLDLIARSAGAEDRRRTTAALTAKGRKIVQAITAARRRLLGRALANWSAADLKMLAEINRRFADALMDAARA